MLLYFTTLFSSNRKKFIVSYIRIVLVLGCDLNKLVAASREIILDKSDLDATIKVWFAGKKQLQKDIDCGNDADKQKRFNLI